MLYHSDKVSWQRRRCDLGLHSVYKQGRKSRTVISGLEKRLNANMRIGAHLDEIGTQHNLEPQTIYYGLFHCAACVILGFQYPSKVKQSNFHSNSGSRVSCLDGMWDGNKLSKGV